MPASLDEASKATVLQISWFTTRIFVAGFAAYGTMVLREQLSRVKRDKIFKYSFKSSNEELLTIKVLWWCLLTLTWMATFTILVTRLLVALFGATTEEAVLLAQQKEVTSSINFCEKDYQDGPYIAETINTASSLACFCPLGLSGMLFHRPFTKRFAVCYLTLVVIGLGSAALHAFLSAEAQGGDELPMLWFCGAAAFCTVSILVQGYATTPRSRRRITTVPLAVATAASSALATVVYLKLRDSFVFFFIIFSIYVNTLAGGLVMVCFFCPWKNLSATAIRQFRNDILLPLGVCVFVVALGALHIWVAEMVYCEDVLENVKQQYVPGSWEESKAISAGWFWNRAVHTVWHMLSGLTGWLLLQVIRAAHGMQQGWGAPVIKFHYGAPSVIFLQQERVNGTNGRKKEN